MKPDVMLIVDPSGMIGSELAEITALVRAVEECCKRAELHYVVINASIGVGVDGDTEFITGESCSEKSDKPTA